MAIYRLYVVTSGIVEEVSVVLFDDDAEAIEHAKDWARGRPVEIWESDRLVAQLAPPAAEGHD